MNPIIAETLAERIAECVAWGVAIDTDALWQSWVRLAPEFRGEPPLPAARPGRAPAARRKAGPGFNSIARAVRTLRAAGITECVEIRRHDGVVLRFSGGTPEDTSNPWDEVLSNGDAQPHPKIRS